MKTSELITYIGNAFTYILVLAQVNEHFQLVELILAILTSVVLLCYRIWTWWKEAKKDGKITKEEIKDGASIIVNGAKEISDKVKKGENKDGHSSKD